MKEWRIMTKELTIEEIQALDGARVQEDWNEHLAYSKYIKFPHIHGSAISRMMTCGDTSFIKASPQIVKQYIALHEEKEALRKAAEYFAAEVGKELGRLQAENHMLHEAFGRILQGAAGK